MIYRSEIKSAKIIQQDFLEYDYLEFISIEHVPMDRRHNAKVD